MVLGQFITFELWCTRLLKKRCVVYDSNTPVTWKHGKGHQTYYDLVDTKKGYNNQKFERKKLA